MQVSCGNLKMEIEFDPCISLNHRALDVILNRDWSLFKIDPWLLQLLNSLSPLIKSKACKSIQVVLFHMSQHMWLLHLTQPCVGSSLKAKEGELSSISPLLQHVLHPVSKQKSFLCGRSVPPLCTHKAGAQHGESVCTAVFIHAYRVPGIQLWACTLPN